MLVLKFAVTAYTGLYFWRWLWPNWLNFIRSFKKIRYMTEKKNESPADIQGPDGENVGSHLLLNLDFLW